MTGFKSGAVDLFHLQGGGAGWHFVEIAGDDLAGDAAAVVEPAGELHHLLVAHLLVVRDVVQVGGDKVEGVVIRKFDVGAQGDAGVAEGDSVAGQNGQAAEDGNAFEQAL